MLVTGGGEKTMNYANTFDNQDVTSYTCKTFGDCVRKRREQLNISLREMAKQINMTPVYLSDIERGNRPAPNGCRSEIDYMSRLIDALYLNSSQQTNFVIMAYMSRMSNINFMDSYFMKNTNALKFFLKAMEDDWNNEQWKEIYQLMFN